jgi:uncharacterized protein (TIGR03118 family)
MPHAHPISPLAKTMCTLALALAPACLHADSFTQINLVSDVPGLAANTDPNLKNPWGVAFSATSPFWTSDQATGLSTLYNGAGTPQGLVVTIPGPSSPPTGPTGMVFSNITNQFTITGGAAATFIFDTLNGTILGWNGGAGTTAVVEVTTPGAVYTGLAQGASGGSNFLYAANSAGGIDVFNSSWANLDSTTFAGKFTDPNLPAGFTPFNIQNVGGNLYVTYAMLGPGGAPMGGGVVDEYDANGNLIKRIASNGAGGALFAPWGVVLAPANFGSFSNDLLIGNFGDGEIDAFDATTDVFLGTINGGNGQPLVNDRLWALETRNAPGFDPNGIYFSAGINAEADGLFGEITAVPEPSTLFGTASGLIALALSRLKRNPRRTQL